MRKTLFVGNLASHEDAGEVERLCAKSGRVLYARVMARLDLFHGHGGFAVAEMEDEADAMDAIRALDGTQFRGQMLSVRPATAAEETAAGHSRMFGPMNMTDDEDEYPAARA